MSVAQRLSKLWLNSPRPLQVVAWWQRQRTGLCQLLKRVPGCDCALPPALVTLWRWYVRRIWRRCRFDGAEVGAPNSDRVGAENEGVVGGKKTTEVDADEQQLKALRSAACKSAAADSSHSPWPVSARACAAREGGAVRRLGSSSGGGARRRRCRGSGSVREQVQASGGGCRLPLSLASSLLSMSRPPCPLRVSRAPSTRVLQRFYYTTRNSSSKWHCQLWHNEAF